MKIIFFNTIALGDYLIHSKIIKDFKIKYNCHITAVCSDYNSRILKEHKHIDKIIIYNKNWSILKKITCLFEILNNKYFLSVVFDCQKFSMLANFLIKSKFKRGNLVVKSKKILSFKFNKFYPPKLFGKILYDKYTIHLQRNDVRKPIYIPHTWKLLFNDFKLNSNKNDIYYFNPYKIENQNKLMLLNKLKIKNYILFHFDHKWDDIKGINDQLLTNLIYLQKKIKKNILITSFKNKFAYFKNIKSNLNQIDASTFKLSIKNKNKIFLINDPNLFLQERLVSSSDFNISCHSGILVHGSGANNRKIVDILNEEEVNYQKCWAPKKNYNVILKKKNNNKIFINFIFNKIASLILKS